jgi:hypothetical protein
MDDNTYPNHGHPHYVPSMCGGATLTRNGHCFSMRHIARIICLVYELPRCTNERTHVGSAHNNDKEFKFCQKSNAFDCGTYGVHRGGAWGLN